MHPRRRRHLHRNRFRRLKGAVIWGVGGGRRGFRLFGVGGSDGGGLPLHLVFFIFFFSF
ncbi:hypothetical protein JHK82_044669 [Glycine max]|nr:hypothetical protein JHK87_044858 [Glycine soja]KAG5099617.1 hypothetical protein JHK82_044669 [Glycine max]